MDALLVSIGLDEGVKDELDGFGGIGVEKVFGLGVKLVSGE